MPLASKERALLVLILLGVVFNQWVVVALFVPEGFIAWTPHQITIWLVDLLLILTGLILIRYRETRYPNVIAAGFASALFTVGMLELVLRLTPRLLPSMSPDFGGSSMEAIEVSI